MSFQVSEIAIYPGVGVEFMPDRTLKCGTARIEDPPGNVTLNANGELLVVKPKRARRPGRSSGFAVVTEEDVQQDLGDLKFILVEVDPAKPKKIQQGNGLPVVIRMNPRSGIRYAIVS